MFDRDIVTSDAFTEMSADAQSLYFHLGINADDDGFISPNGIMRMISAPPDALKLLTVKNFVIPFESGVVVITDWKNHNWLDSRRARPTKYQNELKSLVLTRDKKYVLSTGLANAKRVEYSIEENSIYNTSDTSHGKSQSLPSKVSELIKAFETVDPKNKTYYSNKTQRSACDFLIKEYGFEKVKDFIQELPKINTMKLYVGQITTPFELKEKWVKVANKYQEYKLEHSKLQEKYKII